MHSNLQPNSTNAMNNQIEAAQAVASEAVVSHIATKWGMTGGAVTSVIGWASSSAAAVLIGVVATILGFIVNYVYQHRRHVREEYEAAFRRNLEMAEEARRIEMHQAQLAAIKHTTECR